MRVISRLGNCIISQRVPCVNWKPLFLEETMATGVFISREHYVIEVTIINYLLAPGTSASPKEFLILDPFSSLCSQAYVPSWASRPLPLDVGNPHAEPDAVIPGSFGQLTKQTHCTFGCSRGLGSRFCCRGRHDVKSVNPSATFSKNIRPKGNAQLSSLAPNDCPSKLTR